jgi:hypothetical protein
MNTSIIQFFLFLLLHFMYRQCPIPHFEVTPPVLHCFGIDRTNNRPKSTQAMIYSIVITRIY